MTTGSPTQKPKRFFKTVSIAQDETGWRVELDGRTPKTPAKKSLVVPTKALAAALATEWDSQKIELDLPRMTLTRLANVSIDRTPLTRPEMVAEVQKYGGTDLLCYLADNPAELRERQEAHFAPLRDWAGQQHGVMLMTTQGIINAPQPPASIDAIGRYADEKCDFGLTGLAMGLNIYGSAVLSMAVAEGELSGPDAYDISRIDEIWQIEQWGEDAEAAARTKDQRREAEALGKWFEGLASAAIA